MEKPFVLIIDRYSGLTKKGVNLLAGAFSSQMGYTVLPVLTCDEATEEILAESTVIAVGCAKTHPILAKYEKMGFLSIPEKKNGYAFRVDKDPENEEKSIVLIAGADEGGVLYGCADFCNKYLGRISVEGW